jgi:hypothetical protein
VFACITQYLDTTQPQFYMAIGFAMQLTLSRLRAKKGIRGVIIKQLQRSRTLYIIDLVLSGISDQKSWDNLRNNWYKLPLQFIWCGHLFQTLATISITQLIILPVITRPLWVRVCYMIVSMTLFMLGEWAYFLKLQFQCSPSISEPISWAFVMIAGTFLNDWNEVSQHYFLFFKLVDIGDYFRDESIEKQSKLWKIFSDEM